MHTLPLREGVSPSKVFLPDVAHETLIDFFVANFPKLTREQWCSRFDAGLVLDAAGQPCAAHLHYQHIRSQQTHLFYYRQLDYEPRIPFEARVLFQNERIVVADKPHWLPVIPSGRYVQETLLVRLRRQLDLPELCPVHRIDRDTAGLVLLTTLSRWRNAYQGLFRARAVRKQYVALAPYTLELARYTRESPLRYASHLAESARYMQMQQTDGSPNAVSMIYMLEHIDQLNAKYALEPITGKRHQLRVHMMHLGAPILNDQIYPTLMPEKMQMTAQDYARPLKLLAHALQFVDPVDGKQMRFESLQTL